MDFFFFRCAILQSASQNQGIFGAFMIYLLPVIVKTFFIQHFGCFTSKAAIKLPISPYAWHGDFSKCFTSLGDLSSGSRWYPMQKVKPVTYCYHVRVRNHYATSLKLRRDSKVASAQHLRRRDSKVASEMTLRFTLRKLSFQQKR